MCIFHYFYSEKEELKLYTLSVHVVNFKQLHLSVKIQVKNDPHNCQRKNVNERGKTEAYFRPLIFTIEYTTK